MAELNKKNLGCTLGRMLFKVGNHVITKSSVLNNDRKVGTVVGFSKTKVKGTVVGFTKTKVRVYFYYLSKIKCIDPEKIELDSKFHFT